MMGFVEEFLKVVKRECRTHSTCSKCKYFNEKEEECLFVENPEDWDIESITQLFYYQFKEGENK